MAICEVCGKAAEKVARTLSLEDQEQYVRDARYEWASDELEIDDGAEVSIGETGGYWVAAWVYIPKA